MADTITWPDPSGIHQHTYVIDETEAAWLNDGWIPATMAHIPLSAEVL